MRVGPDKETFMRMYNENAGDYHSVNGALAADGQDTLSLRTFQRRVSQWIRDNKPFQPQQVDEQEDNRPVAGGTIISPDKRRGVLKGTKFVFTAAQNNTFVHEQFWDNLIRYCQDQEAQLVVGKFRYNKSGFQNSTSDKDNDLWYDPKIIPYVIDESMDIPAAISGMVWCGELDILPTAATPLSGLDNYTHTSSSVIPHAKVQLKSVPVLKGQPTKMLYTTGACTQRNYVQRKAGQKAEFHHVFGALLVEIDTDGDHFARQLVADSAGDFYDLNTLYKGGDVQSSQRVEAINWGDIHAEMSNNDVALNGWIDEESMLDQLKPRFQFLHDVTDFRARNHHNVKNPHFLAQTYFAKQASVQEGMKETGAVVKELERDWCQSIVVESNHDQAFRRWLSEADIRTDPINGEYFHTANAELYKRIRKGDPSFHVFEWAIRREVELNTTTFLDEDDSFVICGDNGVECGMHGHRGPNGSRGNPNSLRNLGRKCNIGHTHSATIIDGIYVAGMSCEMDMGYNKGPSSWSHSHIVTYPNGKRTIITMKQGKWRA